MSLLWLMISIIHPCLINLFFFYLECRNVEIMLVTHNISALTNIAALKLSGMPWPTDLSLMLSIELNFYWSCCRKRFHSFENLNLLKVSITEVSSRLLYYLNVVICFPFLCLCVFLHPYLCPLVAFSFLFSRPGSLCLCSSCRGFSEFTTVTGSFLLRKPQWRAVLRFCLMWVSIWP